MCIYLYVYIYPYIYDYIDGSIQIYEIYTYTLCIPAQSVLRPALWLARHARHAMAKVVRALATPSPAGVPHELSAELVVRPCITLAPLARRMPGLFFVCLIHGQSTTPN